MSWTRISERADTADPAAIRAKALDLLARREHSRLELRQKLIQRGFPAERIESALDQLTEERLLDEARFAELYACGRADKGYGPLRIGRELRERGVPQELVDTVLARLEDDWLPKLRELHRKRFKSLAPANAAERMRQTRVLRQHGFTLEQIKHLIFKP
ncbi:MAG: regulatory protein RecX [Candidatus Competibacter sp.]|nr:regulatory protein RecX [Candidatus Competibacter sp.]MDG4583272.1 regulatory protein RecX [Candidatus Competibacter sp.]